MTDTDKYTNMALLYLFRKATEEVKEFNSSAVIQKIGIEVNGVLLSSGRIFSEMEFMERAEIYVVLGALGIRTSLPILDRHSPLAYSIAQYVHWVLAMHRGGRPALECTWNMSASCMVLHSIARLFTTVQGVPLRGRDSWRQQLGQ